MNIFTVWRKVLPFIFIFVLVHFAKDVTQDILHIATPLDLFGDIHERITHPILQKVFFYMGYASFISEIYLLCTIPIVLKRKYTSILEESVFLTVVFLAYYFICALYLSL